MPRPAPDDDAPLYPDLHSYFQETGDTQTNLARLVFTSQKHISRIRAGAAVPRPRLAERIARVCRVPLDSFTKTYLATHGARRRPPKRRPHGE